MASESEAGNQSDGVFSHYTVQYMFTSITSLKLNQVLQPHRFNASQCSGRCMYVICTSKEKQIIGSFFKHVIGLFFVLQFIETCALASYLWIMYTFSELRLSEWAK